MDEKREGIKKQYTESNVRCKKNIKPSNGQNQEKKSQEILSQIIQAFLSVILFRLLCVCVFYFTLVILKNAAGVS